MWEMLLSEAPAEKLIVKGLAEGMNSGSLAAFGCTFTTLWALKWKPMLNELTEVNATILGRSELQSSCGTQSIM